jgi:hypothetical protein
MRSARPAFIRPSGAHGVLLLVCRARCLRLLLLLLLLLSRRFVGLMPTDDAPRRCSKHGVMAGKVPRGCRQRPLPSSILLRPPRNSERQSECCCDEQSFDVRLLCRFAIGSGRRRLSGIIGPAFSSSITFVKTSVRLSPTFKACICRETSGMEPFKL